MTAWSGGDQGAELGLRRQRQSILFADLVESVRLMQLHETATLRRWLGYVETVRERLVPRHGGRLVRTAGDGLLLQCPTASAATSLAHAMHAELAEVNRGVPQDEALWLRVGLHVTEALFDEHEVYGSGVNIAARLSTLAQPGQTLMSAEARAEASSGLLHEIDDLGLHYVKNLEQPLRVFRARPAGEQAPRAPAPADELRPLLAVLPFRSHVPDPAHGALGHALCDEIIGSLVRSPGIRVLARASCHALGDDCDSGGFASISGGLHERLGVAYVLSGHFLAMGSHARLGVELAALPGGEVLWTVQHVADIQALFTGHDTLVPQVVQQLRQHIAAHELVRVRNLPMSSLASYSLYLGASGLLNSLSRSDFLRAREVLEHLIQRHPRQSAPLALLARWHVFLAAQGWSDDREKEGLLAAQSARRALDIEPDQAVAHAALAQIKLNFDADVAASRSHAEQALASDPTEALAWAQLSAALAFQGDHDAARHAAERALTVSPLDPQLYLFESYASMAAVAAARYDDAIELARRSVRHHLLHAPSHRLLVAALWLGGHRDAAYAALGQFKSHCAQARAAPSTPLRRLGGDWRARYEDALRAVGLPD